MREKLALYDFVQQHDDQEFILVELISTEGSTYQKAGAIKVITHTGESVGLISGGCLEGEIISIALNMHSKHEVHRIDTKAETDRLLGYATGCQGVLELKFKKMPKKDLLKKFQLADKDRLKVIVVGAGVDIYPLEDLLRFQKWDYSILTGRSDILAENLFHTKVKRFNKENLNHEIIYPSRTALCLMSHNYPTDLEALSFCLEKKIAYIGILGPKTKYQNIVNDLSLLYNQNVGLDHNIHVPMGDKTFGRGEGAIALSIIAELQKRFFHEKR